MLKKLTYWLAIMACLLTPVIGYVATDAASSDCPDGTIATVHVTQWGAQTSAAEFHQKLMLHASESDITIGQVVVDMAAGRQVRHIYHTSNPHRGLLQSDFGESTTTILHPLDEVGMRSPVGEWVIYGDADKLDGVRALFTWLIK